MSAPKPASVTTISARASAIRSAMTELVPAAMFPKGPQWTRAGPPSRVWSRFDDPDRHEQEGDVRPVEGRREIRSEGRAAGDLNGEPVR